MSEETRADKIRTSIFSLIALILFSVVGVLAIVRAVSVDSDTKCTAKDSKAFSPPVDTLATLAAADGRTKQPPSIDLGFSRQDHQLADYTYAVTGKFPDLSTMTWDFSLVNGNDAYPAGRLEVKFSRASSGLKVGLCLKSAKVSSGTYAGSFTFASANTAPETLPLSVSIKDNNWDMIGGGFIIAILLSVFVKWWTTQLATPGKPNAPSLGAFLTWFRQQWITILIGTSIAAVPVFRAMVLDATTFTPHDRWPFYLATAAAVTASTLVLTSIGAVVTSTSNGQPAGGQGDNGQPPVEQVDNGQPPVEQVDNAEPPPG